MSQMPAPDVPRHALGLPAGSVRAFLATMILVLFWLVLIVPDKPDRPVTMPLAVYCLLGLVLHFYGAHGHTIPPATAGQPSPWHLPRGTFRVTLSVGSMALAVWLFVAHRDRLAHRLSLPNDPAQLEGWPYLLGSLAGGFGLGLILKLGPWRRAAWFQDILAWVSMAAVVGLVIETFLHVAINPTLVESLNMQLWECLLVGLVALYFGTK
jgi:hypothetical protein